jgi:hypothetical protein
MASRREARLQRLGRVIAPQIEAARERRQYYLLVLHAQLVHLAMAEAGLDPALCYVPPWTDAIRQRLAALPYTEKMRAADEALLNAQPVDPEEADDKQKSQHDLARLIEAYRDRTPDAEASFPTWYAWAVNQLGLAERALAPISQSNAAASRAKPTHRRPGGGLTRRAGVAV